jgi:ABC-2 type transport system ATP-binding protein
MKEPIVKVEDFKKRYGNYTAVNGISFEVYPGEIFGLLGPNGAGKTTTLESLEGLRKIDSGRMTVKGLNPAKDSKKLKEVLGVQLQSSGLPAGITVEEALKLFSCYHGVKPSYELLDRFGLKEKYKTAYGKLSVGQQRRLVLAIAMAHEPKLLILDEPTAGLDVNTRVELHRVMDEIRQRGTAILLATHDMAEAEKMADRIAIMLNGKIVVTGTPNEITGADKDSFIKVSVRSEKNLMLTGNITFEGFIKKEVKEEYAVFYGKEIDAAVNAVISKLKQHKDRIIDLRVERPTLEERFISITNLGGVAI